MNTGQAHAASDFDSLDDSRRRRPTISILTILTFFVGLVLGAAGCCYYFFHTVRVWPEAPPPTEVSECAYNLVQIGDALEAYRVEHRDYPMSQYELIPKYLARLPECPGAKRMTYRTSFGPELVSEEERPDHYFIVECCGANHEHCLVAPYSPSYDSLHGLRVEPRL